MKKLCGYPLLEQPSQKDIYFTINEQLDNEVFISTDNHSWIQLKGWLKEFRDGYTHVTIKNNKLKWDK